MAGWTGAAARSGAALGRLARAPRKREHTDHLRQLPRLALQRVGRSSGFFHQRGVLLCHLVHLRDGLVDLFDARGLLLAGCRDLAHDVGHPAHAADDLLHRLAGLTHLLAALLNLADRVVDQHLDFLGSRCRALRQAAHFAGHHGKAAPLFAGPGRFHGGVQRQDVGLKGNAVDHTDDVHDLVRGTVDGVHRLDHLRHHIAPLDRHAGRRKRQLVGLAGVVGVLPHGAGQLFHRRGGFFQRAGLLFGARGQVLVARRDLAGGSGHAVGAAAHFAHHLGQALVHVLERPHQLARFVGG